ncbi:MAG: hypothetical protein WCG95_07630 [bacterium]
MDVKKYYPTANLNYDDLNKDIKQLCINKFGNDEGKTYYKKYEFLTNILKDTRKKYSDLIFGKYKLLLEEKGYNKNLIPIGMLSSNIIANWYLKGFDKDVHKKLKPAFYGRYVDDMLIVIENEGSCNKDSCNKENCIDDRKLSVAKILGKYFCNCGENSNANTEEAHFYKNCEKGILRKPTKEEIENNKILDEKSYLIIKRDTSEIQANKVKLFVFDADSSKALLQKFKDNIRKHSSEFRFLPEDDRIDEDLVNESYSIDYSDTINKLRSIEKCQLDKFKISSYLAKQLILAKYCKDNSHFEDTKKELMYAFNGRLGLELCCYWDKVLTYFLIHNKLDYFIEFVNQNLKNISRINVKKPENNLKDILSDIYSNMQEYLLNSLYLAISLNPNFILITEVNQDEKTKKMNPKLKNKLHQDKHKAKCFIKAFKNDNRDFLREIRSLRKTKLIKHKYCFMPILNFINLSKEKEDLNNFLDYTNENILFELQEKWNNKNNFSLELCENECKYNPRRFSVDEIILFETYKQMIKGEGIVKTNKLFESKDNAQLEGGFTNDK